MPSGFNDEQRAKGRATIAARRKMKNREETMKQAIFEARESGMTIEQVAAAVHTKVDKVKKVLFNGVHKAERIQRFNEALVSRSPKGIAVVDAWLDKGDKDVAMWLLEKNGVVGKEQVNLTINAQNAQVNLSNDTLEAARAVADAMRAAATPKQLQQAADDIIGEIVQQEETSDEQPGVNVGIDKQQSSSGSNDNPQQ